MRRMLTTANLFNALIAAAALGVSAPAMAQGYAAELSCGAVWAPGDAVPFTVRLEEQALVAHNVTIVLTASVPAQPDRELFNGVIALGANQDKTINRVVRLPAAAVAGEYTLSLDADDGVDAVADTCTFRVQ